MLVRMEIKNFALIEHMQLEFAKGITIFTGETGSGKSILMDAFSILLGERASNEFIRHEFSEVEFINREEDMGLPGLRQAKESYNPDHFAEKYDAVYANEADNATGGK